MHRFIGLAVTSLIISIATSLGYSNTVASPSTNQVEALLKRTPKEITGGRSTRADRRVVARIGKAQSLMAANKTDEALELLKSLEPNAKNSYARSLIKQSLAYLYAQSDKIPDAIGEFDYVIREASLPRATLINSYYAQAQLLATQEKYTEAIPLIQDYLFNQSPARADSYFFYAQLLYQLKKSALALLNVEKALSLSESPNKTWLSFAVALYYDSSQYSKAAKILHQLVDLEPKNIKYWLQLSSVYLALEEDEKSLSALQSAKKFGILKDEKDILRLARLAIYNDIPYAASIYLNHGFKNGTIKKTAKHILLLADAYIGAKEIKKAITLLTGESKGNDNPEILFRLGQLYLQEEQWQSAGTSLNEALRAISARKTKDTPVDKKTETGKSFEKLGKLKAEIQLHLAISLARQGQIRDAREKLTEAIKHPATKKRAEIWQGYIEGKNR